MLLKYLGRCALLTTAFALTTYGLIAWQRVDFSFAGVWPRDEFSVHPVHVLALGVAMIAPAIWEFFLLETERRKDE